MKIYTKAQQSYSNNEKHYVPLSGSSVKSEKNESFIVPSKVMIIENISVTIDENLKGEFSFNVDSKFGILQDHKTIPNIDITCNENIEFDEDISLSKLESIIRRCGILEKYSEFFTNDPEIVINSYTLNVKKEYKFFNEFKEGVLIAEDIFE